jgi:SAM-dependent methyltransferase
MQGQPAAANGDDWDSHWSYYGISNALNPAQAYRRRLIFDALALSAAAEPVRVLEIGSGHGELSREIVERRPGCELVGLDLSATGVALARQKVPGASFYEQDLGKPLQVPETLRRWATHAVCSEVLEHLEDPVASLVNIRALLAPRCRLVITVPAGPMSAFDRHIGHRRHFTRRSLEATLIAAGFEAIDVRGAGFPFFNLYRLTVIARGQALVTDVASAGDAPLPWPARAAMRAFSTLFRFNRDATSRGWQLVAVASPATD